MIVMTGDIKIMSRSNLKFNKEVNNTFQDF